MTRQDARRRTLTELVLARSTWHASLAGEQADYTPGQKPDTRTWSRSFRHRAGALQTAAARGISDPDVRRQFIAETDAELARTAGEVEQHALETETGVGQAETDRALVRQVMVAASRSDDGAGVIMGGVNASLDDMVEAGLLSPRDAVRRRRVYAHQFAAHRAADMVRHDPEKAMAVLAGGQPRPAWIGALEPSAKAGLSEAAAQAVRRQDTERALAARTAVYRLQGEIRSGLRSLLSDGGFAGPDPEEVRRALGEHVHRQWGEVRADAARLGALSRDFPLMSSDEISRFVDASRPPPGQADIRRQAVNKRLKRRAAEIVHERKHHPARAALRVASVRHALAEAGNIAGSTPGSVQMLVREMLATQHALGIPRSRMAPVPDEWAVEIGRALAAGAEGPGSAEDDGQGAGARAVRVALQQQFGEFAGQVIAYATGRTRPAGAT